MWYRFLVVTAIIAYICISVNSDPEVYQLSEKRNARRYCGSTLANILSLVCKGIYNTKFNKKSYQESDSDEDYGFGQQQQYIEESKFPFRSRLNAAALVPGAFRRFSRGVYDECCSKPCSTKEIVSYCGSR